MPTRYPSPGLSAGTGFAQGFASIFAPALLAETEEKQKRDAAFIQTIIEAGMKSDDPHAFFSSPAFTKALSGVPGGKEYAPLLATIGPHSNLLTQLLGGGDAGSGGPSAPAAGPSPILGTAGGTTANMSPAPGAQVAQPIAAPSAPAAAPGLSRIQALRARMGEGAELDVGPRGPTLKVKGGTGAGSATQQTAADRRAFGQDMQAIEDQLVQSGIDRGRARRAAYETTSESYRRQGRVAPAPTDPGLQERMRSEAQLAPAPGGGTLAGAVTGTRTTAKIEAEKQSRTLADVKRAGTTYYPEGHAKAGQKMPGTTTVAEAEQVGAVTVPQQTATLVQQLTGPTSILSQAADASAAINTGKTRVEQAERATSILAKRAFVGSGEVTKALVKMQDARATLLSVLRSPFFGEKGNIAARIIERSDPTMVRVWDTKDEARAKLEFFGGVVSAALQGTGVPLTPSQKALVDKLDPSLRQEIETAPGGEDTTEGATAEPVGVPAGPGWSWTPAE